MIYHINNIDELLEVTDLELRGHYLYHQGKMVGTHYCGVIIPTTDFPILKSNGVTLKLTTEGAVLKVGGGHYYVPTTDDLTNLIIKSRQVSRWAATVNPWGMDTRVLHDRILEILETE